MSFFSDSFRSFQIFKEYKDSLQSDVLESKNNINLILEEINILKSSIKTSSGGALFELSKSHDALCFKVKCLEYLYNIKYRALQEVAETATALDFFPECYVALYTYQSQEPGNLCFQVGETILVTKKEGEWWTGTTGSGTGIFPFNYVKRVEGQVFPDRRNPDV